MGDLTLSSHAAHPCTQPTARLIDFLAHATNQLLLLGSIKGGNKQQLEGKAIPVHGPDINNSHTETKHYSGSLRLVHSNTPMQAWAVKEESQQYAKSKVSL